MAEKNSFIVEEARWFAVTMTRPEKDWGASIAVLYGEHALHQLSTTHVWEGERLQASIAFIAALNTVEFREVGRNASNVEMRKEKRRRLLR